MYSWRWNHVTCGQTALISTNWAYFKLSYLCSHSAQKGMEEKQPRPWPTPQLSSTDKRRASYHLQTPKRAQQDAAPPIPPNRWHRPMLLQHRTDDKEPCTPRLPTAWSPQEGHLTKWCQPTGPTVRRHSRYAEDSGVHPTGGIDCLEKWMRRRRRRRRRRSSHLLS
jgi:hypothetical protein